jgi:DNA-binding MarR family transcriptional regulator
MVSSKELDALRSQVVQALPGWTILVIQFNGLIADRLGVTQTDLQCLYALAHHSPASVSDLARRVNLTSGAASRMIDRLEAAGCIRRVPDPHDRRRVLIEPSPQSLEQVSRYYTPLNARLHEDLAEFSQKDLEQLLHFVTAAEDSTEAEIHRLSSIPKGDSTAQPHRP